MFLTRKRHQRTKTVLLHGDIILLTLFLSYMSVKSSLMYCSSHTGHLKVQFTQKWKFSHYLFSLRLMESLLSDFPALQHPPKQLK